MATDLPGHCNAKMEISHTIADRRLNLVYAMHGRCQGGCGSLYLVLSFIVDMLEVGGEFTQDVIS